MEIRDSDTEFPAAACGGVVPMRVMIRVGMEDLRDAGGTTRLKKTMETIIASMVGIPKERTFPSDISVYGTYRGQLNPGAWVG